MGGVRGCRTREVEGSVYIYVCGSEVFKGNSLRCRDGD